ncbi:MAG TPA: GntG family PLP-dependent aldolase, partial [Myxococcales bacterium]|nr:GntG family PLP-dependent aldolase [Myxococcales bacterium]
GEEVICERGAHVVNYEGGAASALWGAQLLTIEGTRGLFDVRALEAVLRHGDDPHYPRQRVVTMENTHNRGGGAVWPIDQMRAVAQTARAAGLMVHVDGARLWNAHVATRTPLAEYGACADTVSVAFSKGLGAPAGSVVATTRARLPMLRRLRKRLGGGMRQVGILAAAAIYALENHLERLAEDHQSARRLAEELQTIRGLRCAIPETNLLFVDVELRASARALSEAGRAEGILFNAESGKERIRLVTHLDVPSRTIPEAVARIRRAADRCR